MSTRKRDVCDCCNKQFLRIATHVSLSPACASHYNGRQSLNVHHNIQSSVPPTQDIEFPPVREDETANFGNTEEAFRVVDDHRALGGVEDDAVPLSSMIFRMMMSLLILVRLQVKSKMMMTMNTTLIAVFMIFTRNWLSCVPTLMISSGFLVKKRFILSCYSL